MHGDLALPPGFQHFPYANPDAPKGGQLRLGAQGSFDSLNPFIFKGVAPPGLREYVYESLMVRSLDEPFSLYGLIAEAVDVPADRGSITFYLRPEARFSDGAPLTADDVVHSYALLREKGLPFHRSYYSKVASAEAIDAHTVRFTFIPGADREIPLILGLMPILPKHRMTAEAFERTTLEPPVGSGPYLVGRVDPGRSILYRRNPEYWGKNLAVMRGRFNFDDVRYDYFRDSAALFEAFKAGEIDVRGEDDPTRWTENYRFPAVEDGRVVQREFTTGLPAGMSALVFNTRRPIFADPRVRRALILAFDAEWINRNLFHSAYKRTQSFFERSALASIGHEADADERALLAPYLNEISPAAIKGEPTLPNTDGSGYDRDALKEAYGLLREAGYEMRGATMVNVKTSAPLQFQFLALTKAQERLALSFGRVLSRLGIKIDIRQVDAAQYWSRLKSFDFDMIQWTYGASLSPGNEQFNRWSSQAADIQGSLNYAGVKSAAADAAMAKLVAAGSGKELTAATRALDRALLSGDYVIPLFYAPRQWIAYWTRVRPPERTPLFGVDFDTWWAEADR